MQVGEGMETGQSELVNKLLPTPVPYEKKKQLKQGTWTHQSRDCRASPQMSSASALVNTVAHGHICFKNKAPAITHQQPNSHPTP